jgi:hypothetical protein
MSLLDAMGTEKPQSAIQKKRVKVIKNFSKNNGLYNSFQGESLFPIESIQHTIFQGVIPIAGKKYVSKN